MYRPRGLYHGLGACALNNESHVALLGLNRAAYRAPFHPTELGLLSAALPHLRRALEIYLRLESYKAGKRVDEAVWDSLAMGVILLDAASRVLWCNRAACALLAPSEGLTTRNGRLTALRPADNAALQSRIRGVVATTCGRHLTAGGGLSVWRGRARQPLSLLVAPLHTGPSFIRAPAAVVFVTDPERKPLASTELLKQLYGLTNREAALANLLMRGTELREAAERLGVSLHTARTFLRYVFRKTETRRQSELVSVLLRGPAGLL
jgi:DNA-binding CsgD family transcriptional regulator